MTRILLPVTAIAVLTACAFDEGLTIRNMEGKIILPPTAATMVVPKDDGTSEEVGPDVRMIGPVYVGLYPAIGDSEFPFPHPVTGPRASDDLYGDAFPYGGTTVGDLRYACFEDLECKIVSGRHVDYDSIIEWMGVFEEPLKDAFGQDILAGDYIRQVCFEQQFYTSDEELRLIPTEDKNGDGVVDAGDLDFVERDDGNFEGSFKIWQQEYVDGFSAWAYMDAPNASSMLFRTCDSEQGSQTVDYNETIRTGSQYQTVLNVPVAHITAGDWVGSMENGIHTYESVDDEVEIWIDFKVGGE